jgi:phage/plasmid-associated DNA primase
LKIKKEIGSTSCTKDIIGQLHNILTKPDKFVDRFDSKQNLFAFSDGKVIDLNNGGQVRDIQKEDYIMTTCGYPYPKRDEFFIDKMMKIINSLSDDPEQIKSILTLLSLPLWGENKNEIFAQLTGTGGNGKGLLDTVTEKTYGDYYYSINCNLLTEYENGSNQANNELAFCRFARVVMATEPQDENKNHRKINLKVPTIKKWTGRDPITTRFLYLKPFRFKPKFVLMMQLNDLIDLSTNDDAIKRRMKVIELPFKFVKNDGQPLGHNERYGDETLKDVVSTDNYRDAFLHLIGYLVRT